MISNISDVVDYDQCKNCGNDVNFIRIIGELFEGVIDIVDDFIEEDILKDNCKLFYYFLIFFNENYFNILIGKSNQVIMGY